MSKLCCHRYSGEHVPAAHALRKPHRPGMKSPDKENKEQFGRVLSGKHLRQRGFSESSNEPESCNDHHVCNLRYFPLDILLQVNS
jgi:hypothetical protein